MGPLSPVPDTCTCYYVITEAYHITMVWKLALSLGSSKMHCKERSSFNFPVTLFKGAVGPIFRCYYHYMTKKTKPGLEKRLSGCPGQVDFVAGYVSFHSHLPIGQVICQLKQNNSKP